MQRIYLMQARVEDKWRTLLSSVYTMDLIDGG